MLKCHRKLLRSYFRLTAVGLLLTLALACGSKPEDVAAQVARDWTSSSMVTVSDTLVAAAVGDTPILKQVAASVINHQVRKNVKWDYSRPSKVSTDRYTVIATASAPIEIKVLVLQQSYKLSAEFPLTVDTKNKKVLDWKLGAFHFSKE